MDALPDVIPLTAAEKTRLAELETAIETHLEGFLLSGKCLAEIRSRRLYRTQYPSSESYLKARWQLPVWKANELIGSFGCYDLLLSTTGAPEGATPLPEHVPEGVVRWIAKLDGDQLKSQVWRRSPLWLVLTDQPKKGSSPRPASSRSTPYCQLTTPLR